MRVASLFSGVGGIELGLTRARDDAELVSLCEVHEDARSVLAHNFPDVPLHRDVRELAALPDGVDVVTAGSPCGDFSSAGNAGRAPRGIDGAASGLLREVFRLLEGAPSVRHVVLENVDSMRTLHGGAGLRFAVAELTRLGFNWAYRVVSARAFGLRQRRVRVVVVGRRGGGAPDWLVATDAPAPTAETTATAPFAAFSWCEGFRGSNFGLGEVPTLRANAGTRGLSIPSQPAVIPLPVRDAGRAVVRLRPEDGEALQGLPRGWTACLPERRRFPRIGNSVPVPLFEWVGAHLDDAPRAPDGRSFDPMDMCAKLPRAAYGRASGDAWAVDVGMYPKVAAPDLWRPSEEDVLSVRATTGYLERARRGRPAMPEWAMQLIRAHAAALAGRPSK